jgi:tRNA1Val (adenine37-N6)-methyltransferase
MSDYLQPDFYRFNEDSLKLVKFTEKKLHAVTSLLDLGAGSGIIGIELANRLRPVKLTLLDSQEEWLPYLKHNTEKFLNKTIQRKIIITTFGEFESTEKYDLIVCNPPYYLPGHGKPSIDKRRERARSFIVDDWDILLAKIEASLTPAGLAFLVVKDDERILKKINSPKLAVKLTRQKGIVFVELSGLDVD